MIREALLITGINGFVGRALCNKLLADGYQMRGAVRGEGSRKGAKALRDGDRRMEAGDRVVVGNIGPETDWSEALDGIDVVVHLAARVHIMNDTVADPLTEFRKVNTAGTLNLARQAAVTGVKRFIFISSIKVNGEGTGERETGDRRTVTQRRKGAKGGFF